MTKLFLSPNPSQNSDEFFPSLNFVTKPVFFCSVANIFLEVLPQAKLKLFRDMLGVSKESTLRVIKISIPFKKILDLSRKQNKIL